MRKLILIFIITNVFFTFGFAQTSNPEFNKTVDSINAIIKSNRYFYYMNNKQYNEFIKEISANEQGIISFTDSIPNIPKREINDSEAAPTKIELISDCCPRRHTRTLDLFAIKKWEVIFPNVYLKDENNEIYGQILGLKKQDIEKLKEQFDKLTTLCKKEIIKN
jgi:hypothetical protein